MGFLRVVTFGACVVMAARTGMAGPAPGDVFREYRWTNAGGDAGGSLRVGGKLDYGGQPIELAHDIDLADATSAELVIEKLLCHAGTQGLAISINGHEWNAVPEAEEIPAPASDYQHHIYPTISLPLAQLKPGAGNRFRLKVESDSPNWPQNLIYGVHIRVYYDPVKKPHPSGKLVAPSAQAQLGSKVELRAEAASPNGPIKSVDFIGYYEGVNLEGDGVYTQWHSHYVRAELSGHIGTATTAPWAVTWDTAWIPDQDAPVRLAARITDTTGITLFTQTVEGVTLARDHCRVELCKPYDVPRRWVTRSGEHEQRVRITGNLQDAVAARLVFCSWSPGYMEGLYINGRKVFEREGPRYAYFIHRIPLNDLSVLQAGENVIKTGKTPKHDGKMVHGMEVNWPGIMLLVQYKKHDSNSAGRRAVHTKIPSTTFPCTPVRR